MLEAARAKFPQIRFMQVDLLGTWPPEINRHFDLILSAYVFHEFDLSTKISILRRLTRHHLAGGGRVIIGDIAFPTVRAREEANRRWSNLWDEDEHYWAGDETMAACEKAGLDSRFYQISGCGGVFVFKPLPQTKKTA